MNSSCTASKFYELTTCSNIPIQVCKFDNFDHIYGTPVFCAGNLTAILSRIEKIEPSPSPQCLGKAYYTRISPEIVSWINTERWTTNAIPTTPKSTEGVKTFVTPNKPTERATTRIHNTTTFTEKALTTPKSVNGATSFWPAAIMLICATLFSVTIGF